MPEPLAEDPPRAVAEHLDVALERVEQQRKRARPEGAIEGLARTRAPAAHSFAIAGVTSRWNWTPYARSP